MLENNEKELEALESLEQWGVHYLWSPRAKQGALQNPAQMIRQLIKADSARLRLGVTAFFLVRPSSASCVLAALESLTQKEGELLKCYYMASVYLLALWGSALASSKATVLPDYFSEELQLPPPTLQQSRLGLVALEEKLQKLVGHPYNYVSSFNSLVRLLGGDKLRETTGSIKAGSAIP